MWTRKPTGRASEPGGLRLGRRRFLRGLLGLAALALLPRSRRAAAGEPSPQARAALEASGFVYVSPLRADGAESTCHGEVWFGWIDGAVVLITGSGTWKARALERGLERARIWVGDHGRWKQWIGRNEAFRSAPSFEAQVSRSRDPELLERLMSTYTRKYPAEFPSWEERMRRGFASGERVLLRYEPV